MSGFRFGADFEVAGDRCDAWLYAPVEDPEHDAPTVVMAPGFAAERRWRLPAFARRFAERGLATLLFDYRGFDGSEGTHHVVDPGRHAADYRAAVERARGLDRTGDRVALWGTGFGAGPALTVAADGGAGGRELRVDALALQVPLLDGRHLAQTRSRRGRLARLAWALPAGAYDRLRALARRPPHHVRAVGEPGERAVLTAPGATAGYERLVPDDEEWANECAARVLLGISRYRPVGRAAEVECPTLVVQGERDEVAPAEPVDELVEAVDDVERVRLDVEHFDAYGSAFGRVADRQAAFLVRHLLAGEQAGGERGAAGRAADRGRNS